MLSRKRFHGSSRSNHYTVRNQNGISKRRHLNQAPCRRIFRWNLQSHHCLCNPMNAHTMRMSVFSRIQQQDIYSRTKLARLSYTPAIPWRNPNLWRGNNPWRQNYPAVLWRNHYPWRGNNAWGGNIMVADISINDLTGSMCVVRI